MIDPGLQARLLAAAVRDSATVHADGRPLQHLTHGVSIREAPLHTDERGSLCEMLDPRWGWHPDPIVSAYMFTIRPGYVKGWNLHKEHEDRYFVLRGEMQLVLFDARPESPTSGEYCRIVLSERRPAIVNVPKLVWHADQNIGAVEVLAVNFPTRAYDHGAPDKYRLPINTDLIPFDFGDAKGW